MHLKTGAVRIIEDTIVLGEHREPMPNDLDECQIGTQFRRRREGLEDVSTSKAFATKACAHELEETLVKVAAIHLE